MENRILVNQVSYFGLEVYLFIMIFINLKYHEKIIYSFCFIVLWCRSFC